MNNNNNDVVERLSAIEVTLGHMDRRLFGNGQPGELALLSARVAHLETQSWKVAGAMGLALFLLNFLTGSGWSASGFRLAQKRLACP